ncbi:MAG: hypothetical protein IKJ67_03170 [Bacteroidales bacterium]|nr:hypothetical protein [Bacteroidales bacterium]
MTNALRGKNVNATLRLRKAVYKNCFTNALRGKNVALRYAYGRQSIKIALQMLYEGKTSTLRYAYEKQSIKIALQMLCGIFEFVEIGFSRVQVFQHSNMNNYFIQL